MHKALLSTVAIPAVLTCMNFPAFANLSIKVNNSSAGTANGAIACGYNVAGTMVATTCTSNYSNILGVVDSGASTTGTANIVQSGVASCNFDSNGVVANDYVVPSTITAGDCADGGAVYPSTTSLIGVAFTTITSAGAANIAATVLGTPFQGSIATYTTHGVYTWVKPVRFSGVQVGCVGAGGGGASGSIMSVATTYSGGGGGGGGGINWTNLPAASIAGSTVTITVGTGGAGGQATTVAANTGNGGSNGTVSTFGTFLTAGSGGGGGPSLKAAGAVGGGPGALNSANTTSGAIGSGAAPYSGTGGGGSSSGGNGTNGSQLSNGLLGSSGGGGGAGFSSTTTAQSGGGGGFISYITNAVTPGPSGSSTCTSILNGAVGYSTAPWTSMFNISGAGGQGGANCITGNGTAGTGGVGGAPGGGGGGGGDAVGASATSGAGGAGADGACIVITQ